MRATVIQQPALRLIVAKSASFPVGNRAAFESLENHLDSLRGRRFYGLVDQTAAGLAYAAGLVPLDEAEATRFV